MAVERVGEIAGDISCQNLTFRYGDFLPNVLDGLSLRIEAGEHVAINGRSGSGKSTLIKLLNGLLQPTSGEIRIGGHLLHGPALRKYVGCVSQNETILPGRVDECIAGTRLRIDIDCVIECAQLAAIHDDILAMPMGYATAIGDMGDTLSGGQKLRLCLARALYRKPLILLLDEATAHLDPATEAQVNAALKRLAITRVVVAHRAETIRSADRVITLEPTPTACSREAARINTQYHIDTSALRRQA